MSHSKSKDALELIRRDVGKDGSFRKLIAQERLNAQVAHMIYEARAKAGLTQKQLADLAETTQPVIARLEDADYEGHSLTMLRRIAEALDRQVVVSFEKPVRRTRQVRRQAARVSVPVRAKKAAKRRG